MRGATILLVACMACVMAALISLGTWQVKRLHWKEALIATVNERIGSEPRPVDEVVPGLRQSAGFDYHPVSMEGRFLDIEPFYEFTTFKGQSGWNVFQAFELETQVMDASHTFVNRGFIPYDMRDKDGELAPSSLAKVQITGLLRLAPLQKPSSMMPDNEIAKRTFYWRDTGAMAVAAGIAGASVSRWYVDEGFPDQANGEGYPVSGTTIITFPNNHLQYAITWYGLALALLGVGSYFLYARRKSNQASKSG